MEKSIQKKRRDKGNGSISANKNGSYTVRLTVGKKPDGKPDVKLRRAKSMPEARKRLKSLQEEFLHNKDYNYTKKQTVEQYMRHWMESTKRLSLRERSYDRLEQTLNHQVVPFIGSLQNGTVSADDVQKLINELISDNKSYSTVKKAYILINECYRDGVIKKTAVLNPALGVKLPNKNSSLFLRTKSLPYYTSEEAKELIKASRQTNANGVNIYRYGPCVPFLINTGLRVSELLGLKREHVSLDSNSKSGSIHILDTLVAVKDRTGKNARGYVLKDQPLTKSPAGKRNVDLNTVAYDALLELMQLSPDSRYIVATHYGNPVNPRTIDRMFRAVCRRAGFGDDKIHGVHSLRHTFASLLIGEGEDIKIVSELMGHSDISVTYNTYVHFSPEQRSKAIHSIPDLL